MNILVGSASWTDKSLIGCGRFYPAGVHTAEARLRHYASVLPMVEVDSSYYAMPSVINARLWVERTPPDFVFNVKAFRLFTGHLTSPLSLPADLRSAVLEVPALAGKPFFHEREVPAEIRAALWRRFGEAVAPLHHAGKLGAVHFQFAPWVHNDEAGREYVVKCVARCLGQGVGLRAAVEFRHMSWWTPGARASTVAFLRQIGAVNVVVDGPQGASNSVPAVWHVTHPELSVVRLHGRNAAAYNRGGLAASSGRFNYDYTNEELAALALQVRRLAGQSGQVHVVFNSNHEDQGQRNARTLLRQLS